MFVRGYIFLIPLLLSLSLESTALGASDAEFHSGKGGFSVAVGGRPFSQRIFSTLENYSLFGESLAWDDGDAKLTISFFEIVDKDGHIATAPNPILLTKWKAYLFSIAQKNTAFKELPFTFEGSKGFELRGTSLPILNRSFFIGSRLYFIGLSVSEAKLLAPYEDSVNTFRRLTKIERIIAMIDENTPPLLPQESPPTLPPADALEMGITGPVRQIRDIIHAIGGSEITFVQQIDFNKYGFKIGEVGFNDGFPDVITNWGWKKGDRINIQSAVNYPDRSGPQSPRRVDVTGFQTFGNTIMPEYGNRFETKFDAVNRPVERRRYANTGALIYVDRYIYSDGVREIQTTDNAGGFISRTRDRLDARGNVIETQILAANGSVYESIRFEYEFDSRGNWVEKRVFKTRNGKAKSGTKPDEVVHREIIYYQVTDLRRVS
ncbi:MAG: hypothetical protein ACKVQJ_15400 [Pyrinomonadaceae bacterium]